MHVSELWEMQQRLPSTPWLMDSGASKHFTMNMSEFSSYESIPANSKNKVITTNGETFIEGKGTVFLKHKVEKRRSKYLNATTHLSLHLLHLWIISRLMSMGEFLHSGLEVRGSTESLELIKSMAKLLCSVYLFKGLSTIYWGRKPRLWCCPKQNVTTIHVADSDHLAQATRTCVPKGTQQNAQRAHKNSLG